MLYPQLILFANLYFSIVTGGELSVALFGNGTFFRGANFTNDVTGLVGTNCHYLDIALFITAVTNIYHQIVFWLDQRKKNNACLMKTLYGFSGFFFFATRIWLAFPFVNEFILHYNSCSILGGSDPLTSVMQVNSLVGFLVIAEVVVLLLWIALGIPYGIVMCCRRKCRKQKSTYTPSSSDATTGLYTTGSV